MNPELLAIDLEELARRIESEASPKFLMVDSDHKLIERVNDQARSLEIVPDFIVQIQLDVRENGSGHAFAIIRDPYRPDLPLAISHRWDVFIEDKFGHQSPDWARCPIPQPASYSEHLRRWAHWVRARWAAGDPKPRFSQPKHGLSKKAAAVRQILLDAWPAALSGRDLLHELDKRGLDETTAHIIDRIIPELEEAGCPVENRGRGYYLVQKSIGN